MELSEIVKKLVGPIQPVGETTEDCIRLLNIKELTDLVDTILGDISSVANNADRQEASMQTIGKHARDFLSDVRSTY